MMKGGVIAIILLALSQITAADVEPLWKANGAPPKKGEVWHVSANWRNAKSLLDSVDDPPDEPFPFYQYTLIELQKEVQKLEGGKNMDNFPVVKKRYEQAVYCLRWKVDQMYGIGMRQWPELLMEDMEPLTWFWVKKKMKYLETEIGGIEADHHKELKELKKEVKHDMKNLLAEIDKIKFDAAAEAAKKAKEEKGQLKKPTMKPAITASENEEFTGTIAPGYVTYKDGRGGRGSRGADIAESGRGGRGAKSSSSSSSSSSKRGGRTGGRMGRGSMLLTSSVSLDFISIPAAALIVLAVGSGIIFARHRFFRSSVTINNEYLLGGQ